MPPDFFSSLLNHRRRPAARADGTAASQHLPRLAQTPFLELLATAAGAGIIAADGAVRIADGYVAHP